MLKKKKTISSGWSLAHGNSVKEKNGEIIKCDFAKTKLPEDINEFPFSKFAQEQFQVSNSSVFLFFFFGGVVVRAWSFRSEGRVSRPVDKRTKELASVVRSLISKSFWFLVSFRRSL